MTWSNETSRHSHEFINFKSKDKEIELPPDSIVSIKGNMDVGIDHTLLWENVPTTIDIGGGGKTITISLGHEETDHHFAGQPIRGVVTLLTPCSDTPGASMEVLPRCGSRAEGGEGDEEEGDEEEGDEEEGDEEEGDEGG
jgi:hypothetical protein